MAELHQNERTVTISKITSTENADKQKSTETVLELLKENLNF